jgi:hypothetical protein
MNSPLKSKTLFWLEQLASPFRFRIYSLQRSQKCGHQRVLTYNTVWHAVKVQNSSYAHRLVLTDDYRNCMYKPKNAARAQERA